MVSATERFRIRLDGAYAADIAAAATNARMTASDVTDRLQTA